MDGWMNDWMDRWMTGWMSCCGAFDCVTAVVGR
jgi:hypothetical protein